jgi:hypothetical protein
VRYQYEERQSRNDQSRRFATRDGLPWTEAEHDYLREHWIDEGSKYRDERQVASDLNRTIESCRQQVNLINGTSSGIRYNTTALPDIEHCWSREDNEEYPQEWYSRR